MRDRADSARVSPRRLTKILAQANEAINSGGSNRLCDKQDGRRLIVESQALFRSRIAVWLGRRRWNQPAAIPLLKLTAVFDEFFGSWPNPAEFAAAMLAPSHLGNEPTAVKASLSWPVVSDGNSVRVATPNDERMRCQPSWPRQIARSSSIPSRIKAMPSRILQLTKRRPRALG
jgi:hypothetical protein